MPVPKIASYWLRDNREEVKYNVFKKFIQFRQTKIYSSNKHMATGVGESEDIGSVAVIGCVNLDFVLSSHFGFSL